MWSNRAENIVRRLIASLSPELLDPARTDATRLAALHIGGSMWAEYYLRPNGEVVIVGEDYDRPNVDSFYSNRAKVLSVLVWGAKRYPELQELLPVRPTGAADCICVQHPTLFGPDKVICADCGGVGWLPAETATAN